MFLRRHLFWIVTLVLLVPPAASAQPFGQRSRVVQPGYQQGYERGLRAGSEDARRGADFNFSISVDFRRGDLGYRSQFGSRDRYRNEFRRAFQLGYQAGYGNRRGRIGPGLPGRGGAPLPWGGGRGGARFDPAVEQGYSDGYEAGLDDGRDGRRFDPVGERRYRNGDRNYNSRYGSRERYKINYRSGFMNGYERGYADATRYDRRWPTVRERVVTTGRTCS